MQFNKNTRFSKFLASLGLIMLLACPNLGLAQVDDSAPATDSQTGIFGASMPGLQIVGGTFGTTEGQAPKDIRVITVGVIQILLGLIGVLFVVLILVAGFRWMFAQGNATKITEARNIIIQAAIGLVIILAAFGITIFILRSAIATTNTQDAETIKMQLQYQNY
jgi:energy-coupling factor transporter transmembrane protein EcfT